MSEKMFREKLTEALSRWDLTISEKQAEQFEQFYLNLIEWDKVMNLTAITEENDVIEKHFLDCLAVPALLGEKEAVKSAKRIIDEGLCDALVSDAHCAAQYKDFVRALKKL